MTRSNSFAKNAVFNILYKILNVIFPLLSSTYVARILLPDGVGHVAYAQNIVSYFTLIAALGIPTYGTREISKARNSQYETNHVFSELLIINACSTFVCLLAYGYIVLTFFSTDINLYLVCGLLIAFNFINIDWFYQGKEEYAYIAIRSSVIKIISLISIFVFVKEQEDYLKYAFVTVLATGGNYIFNIIHSRKYVHFTLSEIHIGRHLRPILYLVVCVISTELYSKIDTTMLGALYNKQVVGYYTNAQKLVQIVIVLCTAISAIFLPRISFYFENNRDKYNDYILLGIRIISFIAIPAFVGIILISDSLTFVMFGDAFMPAANTIRTLSALIIIKSFGDLLCYQVIISSGNEKKLLKSYLLAAFANVILNAFLIPIWAQDGAAIASVVSEFALNTTLLVCVTKKITKIRFEKEHMKSIIIASICMTVVVCIIGCIVQNYYVELVMQLVFGIMVYLFVNSVMKNEIMSIFLNRIMRR